MPKQSSNTFRCLDAPICASSYQSMHTSTRVSTRSTKNFHLSIPIVFLFFFFLTHLLTTSWH